MRLAVEILDHIFSFLVWDRETLFACFKDPVLFPITERHFYRHLTVHIAYEDEEPGPDYAFEPHYVSKLVAENPLILTYVRILEIQIDLNYRQSRQRQAIRGILDEFAKTLLMFPSLACIILTTKLKDHLLYWPWSDGFRAALEDRLHLPTLKELHLTGDFPPSLLDNCRNIEDLSLSGTIQHEVQIRDSSLPQLKSLAFNCSGTPSSLMSWFKLHISELQSLKCMLSSVRVFSELLGVCSETLNKLEVDLRNSPYYGQYRDGKKATLVNGSLELSPIHLKLQHLTIRTEVSFHGVSAEGTAYNYWGYSWLPAAAEIINLLISESAPRQLVLDINIRNGIPDHFPDHCIDLTLIDFSPLEVLGAASVSIPRIDVYIHTGIFQSTVTQAQLLSSLDQYEDVMRSITEGVVVIHSEKTAPDSTCT